MLQYTREETEFFQKQARSQCESEIKEQLYFGRDLFNTMFPHAKIVSTAQNTATEWPAERVLVYKTRKISKTALGIFDDAVKLTAEVDYEPPPLSVKLPPKLGQIVLKACLSILTFGRDLSDVDYYFLHDTGNAFNLPTSYVYSCIEQQLYHTRKQIFAKLKAHLSETQCEVCALLLLKAIRADDCVHPAEIKYFEIVAGLLDNNQTKLEQLESRSSFLEQHLPISLTDEIAEFLFKYLVEIVMCDKEYDSTESQFIKEIASAFSMDQTKQDTIIQPVAAALMVKMDLFQ